MTSDKRPGPIWSPLPTLLRSQTDEAIRRAGFRAREFVLAGETREAGGKVHAVMVVRSETPHRRVYRMDADGAWMHKLEEDLKAGAFGDPPR